MPRIVESRPSLPAKPTKFMHLLRSYMRKKGLAASTEKNYCGWVKRFIKFHQLIHPDKMNELHVEQFLHHLVAIERVTINTQKSALNALAFLFNKFLDRPLEELKVTPAKKGPKLPTVISHFEAQAIIKMLRPPYKLVVQLLYGSGLRLNEALSIRLKDLDFETNKLAVVNGKGGKNRFTVLPVTLNEELRLQIEIAKQLYNSDRLNDHGWAHSNADEISSANTRLRSLPWQYLFPSSSLSFDSVRKRMVRSHLSASSVQRHLKVATNNNSLIREVTPHTFRHTFATRLLETGTNIRVVQQLLGHASVTTTEIYTHVLHKHGFSINSPIDDPRF